MKSIKKSKLSLIVLSIVIFMALLLSSCTPIDFLRKPSEKEVFKKTFSLDIRDEDMSFMVAFDDRGSIFYDGSFEYIVSFNNGANISEMTALWENLPLDRKADSFLKLLSQKEIVLPNIENGRWKFIDKKETA